MEVFLLLNGNEIRASVDEQERLMLGVASGSNGREQLAAWLEEHAHGVGGAV
jgi:death-on-curing protein